MMSIDQIIRSERPKPLIIAHRGASHYFHENTMEAFTAAVDMGAEMVEFDVRRTADNVLVIHHDQDFAGSNIMDMTTGQLHEKSGSAGYKIPTLIEVLELVKDKLLVDIELKEPGYEEHVLETVLGVLEQDQFVISSFHDSIIRKVKNLHSGIRTGLNFGDRPRRQLLSNLFPGRRVRRTGADILVISQKLLKLGFLSTTRGLGLPVWVYTVNDRQELWKMITEERVDGIFSNRPDVGLFLRDLHTVEKGAEKPTGVGVSE